MAPVTLPPSFFNSFWSPDYRSGIEVLFKNLEQGCLENNDIVTFIESQAKGHQTLAKTLLSPPLSSTSTSSSLQHSLLSLRGASSARGEAHKALADDLETKVAGFRQWKDRHEDRVKAGRDEMLSKTGVIGVWEKDVQKLLTLRQSCMVKSRAADDSEDDAKFAPATTNATPSTGAPPATPKESPKDASTSLRRSGTVADRINAKLRDANVSPTTSSKPISIDGKELPPPPSPVPPLGHVSPGSPTTEEAFIPPTDPDGKPTINGATSTEAEKGRDIPPQPILLSGLALPAQALQDLLHRFEAYLLTTPAPYSEASLSSQSRSNTARASRQRSNILGTYEKTFSGEEVVNWLREHVEGFGGDYERSNDAAEELYRMGHFSRIGVGRGFDPSYDTYYILKSKPHSTGLGSGSFSSPLSPTTNANIQNMMKHFLPSGLGAGDDEPLHVKLRREAVKADEAYRAGVDGVEEKRLEMEERIERGLRIWERWERERLAVIKAVLKQYGEAVTSLSPRLAALTDSTNLSIEAFNPEADLKALIEGNRTGPFRPQPHVYDSVETPDVHFGIDLRKWSGELGWKGMMHAPQRPKGSIPEVLEVMLSCLNEMYETIPDDGRRKAWIYEVPLVETHTLRNMINRSHTPVEELEAAIKQHNVPVIAGAVKLYLLELNPPVMGWEGWEDAKAVYPQIGADQERDVTSALTSVLSRLSSIHLYVLNAVVKHFVDLIEATTTDEPKDNYITKLSLSVGRCILRPQYDTDLTIGDRTPSLFLSDLIKHYSAILPGLVEKKKKDVERVLPVRKRTALVDQRMSRSQLGGSSTGPTASLSLGGALMEEPDEMSIPPVPPIHKQARQSKAIPPSLAPVATSPSSMTGPPQGMISPPDSPGVEEAFVPPGFKSIDQDEVEPSFVPPVEKEEILASPRDLASSPVESVTGGTASGGASGLKRATSGEASSRLRGPRGARGPRPAPGRVSSGAPAPASGVGSGNTSPVVADTNVAGGASSGVSDGEGGVGGKGASGLKRGSRVHKAGSSVSQAIQNFEGRSG